MKTVRASSWNLHLECALICAASLTMPGLCHASDVGVGFREISGVSVGAGTETLSGRVRLDPSATLMKTGAGTLVVPAASVDDSAPWSVDVLGGKLKVDGSRGAAPDAAPAVMQKAVFWVDASGFDDGSEIAVWNDVRAGGNYAAVARQLGSDTPAPPVAATVNGVRCVNFGGVSDKYMRFQKNGADASISNVQHWFVVFGFASTWSAPLGYVSSNTRSEGILTTISGSGLEYYDNSNGSPYFYPRGDLNTKNFVGRYWLDGRRFDPYSTRPKKGFQLLEGDQVSSPQTFQAFFSQKFETFGSGRRAGGNYLCEVALFNMRLTEAERLEVERYLLAKWALPRAKASNGNTSREGSTGVIRTAENAEAEISVPEGGESPALAFSGRGSVVKTGPGTLTVGPSAARPLQGEFTLEAGGILLRGGAMPAVEASAGETWDASVYPATRPSDAAGENSAGVMVARTGGQGGIVRKTGVGEVVVRGFSEGVKGVHVENGILRLAAREAPSPVDAGIGDVSVAIPNASFEEPFAVGANQSKGLWGTTINSWYGMNAYYMTQVPAISDTWTTWPTPCGTNTMMVIDGGYCRTPVLFPRAGTYELAFWATSRYGDGRRARIDIKYNGRRIGHHQTAPGPYVKFRFRFDIAAEDAGTAHDLEFAARGDMKTDANTIIDGLEIHAVPDQSDATVVKVPGGDFERRNYPSGQTGMDPFFSRAMELDGWTLSLADGAPSAVVTNGYIAFCSGGCPARGFSSDVPFFPSQDYGSGTGVLGFFDKYGRAETRNAFTLPAGKWILRGELAWWPSHFRPGLGSAETGNTANPAVGAWLVRGDGSTNVLGTVSASSHILGRVCWPTVIEVDGSEEVRLVVGNTNSGAGVLDNLAFVPAEVASDETNLVADPGFERGTGFTKFDSTSDYFYNDSGRHAYDNVSSAFGYNAFEGDFCLRLHNSGGVSVPVAFPAPGLYRITWHMRPRQDDPFYAENPVRVFLRLGDGRDLEIFRQASMPRLWHFAEYSAMFEIPEGALPADGRLDLCFHGLGKPSGTVDPSTGKDKADRTTLVDGISVVKVDSTSLAMPTVPDGMRISLKDGAQIHLDYPGKLKVMSLRIGPDFMPNGEYSAASCPGVITGMGSIVVENVGTQMIIR